MPVVAPQASAAPAAAVPPVPPTQPPVALGGQAAPPSVIETLSPPVSPRYGARADGVRDTIFEPAEGSAFGPLPISALVGAGTFSGPAQSVLDEPDDGDSVIAAAAAKMPARSSPSSSTTSSEPPPPGSKRERIRNKYHEKVDELEKKIHELTHGHASADEEVSEDRGGDGGGDDTGGTAVVALAAPSGGKSKSNRSKSRAGSEQNDPGGEPSEGGGSRRSRQSAQNSGGVDDEDGDGSIIRDDDDDAGDDDDDNDDLKKLAAGAGVAGLAGLGAVGVKKALDAVRGDGSKDGSQQGKAASSKGSGKKGGVVSTLLNRVKGSRRGSEGSQDLEDPPEEDVDEDVDEDGGDGRDSGAPPGSVPAAATVAPVTTSVVPDHSPRQERQKSPQGIYNEPRRPLSRDRDPYDDGRGQYSNNYPGNNYPGDFPTSRPDDQRSQPPWAPGPPHDMHDPGFARGPHEYHQGAYGPGRDAYGSGPMGHGMFQPRMGIGGGFGMEPRGFPMGMGPPHMGGTPAGMEPVRGEVIEVPRDGNCGFSALDIVLRANPDILYDGTPDALRHLLADRLESYWHIFFSHPMYSDHISALHDIRSLPRVVQQISHPGTWLGSILDQFELIVLASEFRVRILIVMRVPGRPDPRHAVYLRANHWPMEHVGAIVTELVPVQATSDLAMHEQLPTIYLLLEDDHYQPIVPLLPPM